MFMSYRKIWEAANGPIPYDVTGRRMEIHHIDGKRTNNSLENLKLVTIQDHYDIHYSQGDWAACQSLVNRMKISSDEKSKRCSELANKRVTAGTHHFQDPEFIKADSLRKSRDRKGENHPLYGKPVKESTKEKRSQSHKLLVEQGIHHLQQDTHKNRMREKALLQSTQGEHPFQQETFKKQQKEKAMALVQENKHPFNRADRTDPNKIMVWCDHCRIEVSKPVFGRYHKH